DAQVVHQPIIAAQPADQTVALYGTASFSVTAVGSPAPTYQWLYSGSPIGGATSSVYVRPFALTNDDGALISVVVSNQLGSVVSRGALLHIVPDSNRPTLTAAFACGYGATNFDLVYSEPIQPSSALQPSNYSLHPGVPLTGTLVMDQDTRTIHF